MSKYCPHCHCNTEVIRFGTTSSDRQRYRCQSCKHTWTNKSRPGRRDDVIWSSYATKGLQIKQLCEQYHLGKDKIREILKAYQVAPIIPPSGTHNVIGMDCTYSGRKGIDMWGLLIIIDLHTGECLYCEEIPGYETYAHYITALNVLRDKYSITPKACVIDGVTGLAGVLALRGILVQYCQFHQIKTVLSYITRNPVLEPNKELKSIVTALTHVNRKTFTTMFNAWFYKHKVWLNERHRNPETGKLEYTHAKTRSAVRSIQRNFEYLYTFEQHPDLQIPNTNNALEGINSAIKSKLNHHRGARKELKTKLVRNYLSGRTGV